jgi:hypothetical protein
MARLSVVAASRLDPPAELGMAGAALWRSIQAEYAIDDVGGRALLEQICGAADRIQSIKEEVAADGPVIRSRGSLRAHPCLQAEIQNRALIMRGLEKLGITVQPVKPHGHPAKPTGWTPPELG